MQNKTSFEDWLNLLNKVAGWNGYKGRLIVDATGAESWRHFYDEGLTPAAALESAERDGATFGQDYCE